jgi:hypothetical protein
MDQNPFQAPNISDASSSAANADEYYVNGNNLVVRSGVVLPKKCVFCNKEQGALGKRISAKLYYVSPLIYLLLLVNLLILILIYMLIRKRLDVTYSICGEHKKRKNYLNVATFAALVLTIGAFMAAGVTHTPALSFFGILCLLAFLVLLIKVSKGLTPKKHENGQFWLGGCGPEFLQEAAINKVA